MRRILTIQLTKLSYEYVSSRLLTDPIRVAYNHGRPVAFLGENIMQLGRGLLKHPLSLLSDSRLVVSVELQACRCELSVRDSHPAHTSMLTTRYVSFARST